MENSDNAVLVKRPETRGAPRHAGIKKFSRRFSEAIRALSPSRFIALHKISLRTGKIFITVKSGSRSVSRTKILKMTKKKSTRSPRWDIDALAIINTLQAYVTGKKTLTPSQVTAALTLLKKRLPDPRPPQPKKQRTRHDPEDTGSLKDLA